MKILGISAYYHDSAACLVVDGQLVAAAQEERFTRIKHDQDFPNQAIAYCLQEANCSSKDIDYVVFYDKPLHDWSSHYSDAFRYLAIGLDESDDSWSSELPINAKWVV